MANEIIKGSWPPDCTDPCIAVSPLRTIYQVVDSPIPASLTSGLLIRTTYSGTCQASDWQDICDVCGTSGTAGSFRVVNNGDGTFSAYNDTALIGTWSQAGPTGATGATGPAGADGVAGVAGVQGLPGADGLSAYQIWINAGNTGTEADFLASLAAAGPTISTDANNAITDVTTDGGWYVATSQTAHPAATANVASNPALTVDAATQVANLDLTTPGSFPNTGTTVTADNVQGAITEIAAADRPFRQAGAVGADGLATQPTSADPVTVDSSIQHRGATLLGGVDGDTPIEQLHVKGDARLDNAIPSLVLNRDGITPALAQARMLMDQPAGHTNPAVQMWHSVHPTVFLSLIQLISELDIEGNFANTSALDVPTNQAEHVWHSVDERTGIYETKPPTVPLGPWHTAHFALNVDEI